MNKMKLVLIGNGMAGIKCMEYLIQENPDLYDITVFGSEPYTNYSRIQLSSVLQGKTSFEEITLHSWEWYEKHDILLYPNETVILIDPEQKEVITNKKRSVHFDKLIIATGSSPFMLPIPGTDKDGVVAFRTIEDCKRILKIAKNSNKAAVVGGGILGLEAAQGLLNLGMKVDVIHLADRIMNQQLDNKAAELVQNALVKQGLNILLQKETAEIYGDKRVEGIRFKDNTEIKTDLIVMAVGVKPNVALAKKAGIKTNRGIVINDFMETNIEDIYALGECAEHNGTVYGLVKPLYEQAQILAKHLCQCKTLPYQGSTLSTRLKASGIELFSAGQTTENEDVKAITAHDEINQTYKKMFFRKDKLIGTVLFGDISTGHKLLDQIKKKKFIPDPEKQTLMMPVKINESYAAQLAKDEQICTCNHVTKAQIIEQVVTHNLQTIEQVKKCTKASSSCGGCKSTVDELIRYIHSDYFDNTIESNHFCSCTTLTEEQVVEAIIANSLTSVVQIRQVLGWSQAKGCSYCQEALAYYLEMIDVETAPSEDLFYIKKGWSAIKQKNGTYSISPQLYGGMVEARQLKRISEIALKYALPSLEINEHQRIVLHQIPVEKLDDICEELQMKLYPYTDRMLSNVQISHDLLCDCQKKSLTQLAIEVEKQTEYLRMPTSLSIRVCCCQKDRYTTDIHIILSKDGWELKINDRKTMNHTIVNVSKTTKEVRKMLLALLQYYRQSAKFNEPISTWINRMGIIHVREILFNKELQNLLLATLVEEQRKRTEAMIKQTQP
ncbi:nitrite reductase large subunit NirB [Gracilibacillus dipsosauri]|uniref:nitrite reductase large subunit NirB n=1 Tax=Gracilibacillus dipsosauri TaxID=178340 RepID=UPI00240932FC